MYSYAQNSRFRTNLGFGSYVLVQFQDSRDNQIYFEMIYSIAITKLETKGNVSVTNRQAIAEGDRCRYMGFKLYSRTKIGEPCSRLSNTTEARI